MGQDIPSHSLIPGMLLALEKALYCTSGTGQLLVHGNFFYLSSPFLNFGKSKCELNFLFCVFFFFFSFQCSDKSCLRTPSLKKRVIDINLEGKKDSGMLKYIRHQVLTGPYAGWGDCYINVSSNCNRKENMYGSLSLCEGKNCRC